MNTVYFLVQQTMFFSIPLLIVALGGMFSERSGVVNIALEGIMIMGAFSSILFINIVQSSGAALPPQLLLLLAVLIAAAVGVLVSMAHAYASINMKADQVISGTAINMFAPAFAIFAARMIRSVQQIPFSNTFRITKVPVLGDIPVLGPLLFQNTYITTYLGFAVLAVSAVVLYKTRFGLRLRACGEHPRPSRILFAAFFFGLMKTVASAYSGIPFLANLGIPNDVYKMVPYVATLIVLAFTSKNSMAPRAEGIPYDKGSR